MKCKLDTTYDGRAPTRSVYNETFQQQLMFKHKISKDFSEVLPGSIPAVPRFIKKTSLHCRAPIQPEMFSGRKP